MRLVYGHPSLIDMKTARPTRRKFRIQLDIDLSDCTNRSVEIDGVIVDLKFSNSPQQPTVQTQESEVWVPSEKNLSLYWCEHRNNCSLKCNKKHPSNYSGVDLLPCRKHSGRISKMITATRDEFDKAIKEFKTQRELERG